MTDQTISLPMREEIYKLSQERGGWIRQDRISAKSARALERRGAIRNALDPLAGESIGYALTIAGRAYVEKHWPACPALMENEPEGGWTPREGVGWE